MTKLGSRRGKVVAITQARIGSTRLPGKILLQAAGKPLLEHHLGRVARSKLVSQVVVATTTGDDARPILEICDRLGIAYFQGSTDDVLARYAGAATKYDADVVVRLTSDCPLIDPAVIDEIIQHFLDNRTDTDYVSNCRLERTFPRGMDTEVLTIQCLREAHAEATSATDREHVTPFIWRQPDRFKVANISFASDQSRHRWTVDTADDFELVRRIIEHLYPTDSEFTLQDSLSLMDAHPDWPGINSHVEQRALL